MGEIADYILNGDDCEGCGEYLGNGDGLPRRCASCRDNQKKITPKIKKQKLLSNLSYAISKLIHISAELNKSGYGKKSRSMNGLIKNLDLFYDHLENTIKEI